MNNNTIDSNLLRQIFFIAIILFLGIILFRELWFFTSAFLGAVTFYVIMRERMFYLTENKGWKPGVAAMVLMLLSFFVILVPIVFTIFQPPLIVPIAMAVKLASGTQG